MKLRKLAAVLFIFLFGLLSCDLPERDARIAFGQQFRLDYDQTVLLEDETRIRFLELKKDNRCPEDALCPFAGEAIIVVALEHEDRLGSIIELKIPGLVTQYSKDMHKQEEIWGYRFTLLQLDPYPLVEHLEPKSRYAATLVIEKLNGEESL